LADMIFEKLEAGDTPMGADDDGGPPGKKVRIASKYPSLYLGGSCCSERRLA
jgi:hypothetical protein